MKEKENLQDNKPCRTVLIDDIPEENDLFGNESEIGPHQRVANTIADIIIGDEEKGGKMVGLEGGWGSGKSTVINLLTKKINTENKNIHVHYFDAWAHEGDPLRRTFLESLIHKIQVERKEWIDLNKWNKTLEELAKRRKEHTTRTIPKITKFGKWLAIASFFVPIGLVCLSIGLDGETISTIKLILTILGGILTTLPIWVMLLNSIRPKIFTIKSEPDQNITFEREFQKHSQWAFLFGHSITDVTQETTETPEPTSIEFEARFRDLMQECLSKDISRKIVIIVDNLDRIDEAFALSIWSTLQTFLQDRTMKKDGWFSQLWIIVPYDRKGIQKLWSSSEDVSDKEVVNSFIDKSFQLIFESPPLVLSNWKDYLINLLKKALPDHTKKKNLKKHIVFIISPLLPQESPQPPEK